MIDHIAIVDPSIYVVMLVVNMIPGGQNLIGIASSCHP